MRKEKEREEGIICCSVSLAEKSYVLTLHQAVTNSAIWADLLQCIVKSKL